MSKKFAASVALILSVLGTTPAFATSFQVVCAGEKNTGENNVSTPSPQEIAKSLNQQLDEIAKTKLIVAVSSPMVSTGTSMATNGSSWGGNYIQLVCVTVQL